MYMTLERLKLLRELLVEWSELGAETERARQRPPRIEHGTGRMLVWFLETEIQDVEEELAK